MFLVLASSWVPSRRSSSGASRTFRICCCWRRVHLGPGFGQALCMMCVCSDPAAAGRPGCSCAKAKYQVTPLSTGGTLVFWLFKGCRHLLGLTLANPPHMHTIHARLLLQHLHALSTTIHIYTNLPASQRRTRASRNGAGAPRPSTSLLLRLLATSPSYILEPRLHRPPPPQASSESRHTGT